MIESCLHVSLIFIPFIIRNSRVDGFTARKFEESSEKTDDTSVKKAELEYMALKDIKSVMEDEDIDEEKICNR